jgi:hypothetical protein
MTRPTLLPCPFWCSRLDDPEHQAESIGVARDGSDCRIHEFDIGEASIVQDEHTKAGVTELLPIGIRCYLEDELSAWRARQMGRDVIVAADQLEEIQAAKR